MAESPVLNVRISAELRDAIDAARREGETMSDCARRLLAEKLKLKRLAPMKAVGRPKVSENS